MVFIAIAVVKGHSSSLVVVVAVIEEVVGGDLLILVTCEVGLEHALAWEAQSFEPSDGLPFLGSDLDDILRRGRAARAARARARSEGLGELSLLWGDRLLQELHELLLVVVDELEDLRIVLPDLLQQGLQQLRVLLDESHHLHELGVLAEGAQWRLVGTAATCRGPAFAAPAHDVAQVEERGGIAALPAGPRVTRARLIAPCVSIRRGHLRICRRSLWDSRHQVLHRALGIAKGRVERREHLRALEAHVAQLCDRLFGRPAKHRGQRAALGRARRGRGGCGGGRGGARLFWPGRLCLGGRRL
mmetsp:Transcript_15772/g.42394  ORF Transcript_15772/g.42394 Transcript_15772/m.42394 type:complete len:302 (+) Transcript_15772:501-1406(+)